MRTPISYYGGKQTMIGRIIPLIPKEAKLYAEPFIGGAAIFFAKEKHNVEVINDTNKELINFYKVVQNDYYALDKHIRITLHSRDMHRKASVIYNNPDMFDDVKRAWAVWVLSNQSFNSILDGSWGYERKTEKTTKKLTNKREAFTEEIAIRLQNVQIECADALYIIRNRDMKESFFYCDPPYFNANMGHYDGYTIEDFEMLLKTLSAIEGKFLLSSYPSDILKQYTKEHGWNTIEYEMHVSAASKNGKNKRKIEVLTANYPIRKID